MRPRNKRSLTIARHRTSVSLEQPFWTALTEIAKTDGKSVASLVEDIDRARSEAERSEASLSSAIRLYVLERMRRQAP